MLSGHGTLPLLPDHVAELIGTVPEGETPLNDSDPTVKSLLEQLGAHDWPDFEIAFDPAIGWSLESLREHAPEFCSLYDSPGADRSTNRFTAARYLLGASTADGEKLPLAFIRVDVDLFNDKKAAQAIVEAVGLLEVMTNLQCSA